MRVARWCLAILLFLLPLVGGRVGPVPLAALAAVSVLGWAAWARTRPAPVWPAWPLRWPLLALLGISLLTTATSVYHGASLLGVAQVVLLINLTALAAVLAQEHRHLTAGALAFTLGVLLSLLFGWWDWVTWLAGRGTPDWRITGPWDNPNVFAGFLILCLPVLSVLAVRAERSRWLFGLTAALLVPTVVMTQSRGGLLALLVMLVVFVPAWAWAEGKLTAKTLGLAALGFVLLIGLALLSPLGKRVLDPAVRARQLHSQLFRYYTWQGALRMANAHPWLGTGPNTFASAYGQYQFAGYTRNGHSLYLQTAAETGWPGLAVLLILFGGVALLGLRTLRVPSEDADLRRRRVTTGVALLCGLFGLLVHGVVDADWLYPGVQMALLLQAVLVWRLGEVPAAKPAPATLLRLLPLGAAAFTLALVPAALAQRAADAARLTADPAQRTALLRTAVSLAPRTAAYLRDLALLVPTDKGEAQELIVQAQRVEPTNAANWLYQGHVLLRAKQAASARVAYATAERKQPHLLPALYGQARAAWEAGDRAGCRVALRRLLAQQHSELDRLRPIEVPEAWYVYSWYAEAYLARAAHDADAERQALRETLQAARDYEAGFTVDAEALRRYTGASTEETLVHLMAVAAHRQLADALEAENPAGAATERALAETLRGQYFPRATTEQLTPPDTAFP